MQLEYSIFNWKKDKIGVFHIELKKKPNIFFTEDLSVMEIPFLDFFFYRLKNYKCLNIQMAIPN